MASHLNKEADYNEDIDNLYPWPIWKGCDVKEIELIISNWTEHNTKFKSFCLAIVESYQQRVPLPIVVGQNAYYEEHKAENTLKVDGGWNAGHISGWGVPNWCIFDFKIPTEIISFGLINCGDYTHDIRHFRIQFSNSIEDINDIEEGIDFGWKHNDTFTANSYDKAWQIFKLKKPIKSRYFRVYIMNRYTQYQAYVKQFAFKVNDT